MQWPYKSNNKNDIDETPIDKSDNGYIDDVDEVFDEMDDDNNGNDDTTTATMIAATTTPTPMTPTPKNGGDDDDNEDDVNDDYDEPNLEIATGH